MAELQKLIKPSRGPILLYAALAFSLLAAAVPAGLCIFELMHLRDSISKINEASARVKQTRDVLDKIGQGLVGFAAIALDVTAEDRAAILAETDRQFSEFGKAVERVNASAGNFVSPDQQEQLSWAVARLERSWNQFPTQLLTAQKSYHFLQVLDNAKLARDVLVVIEAAVRQAEETEIQSAFERLTRAGTLLIWLLLIGTMISIFVTLGIYYFAVVTRKGNIELEQRDRQLKAQNDRFDTAVNSMRQGFLMFDAEGRLILANQRYAEMYRLSAENVKPGATLLDLLHLRKAAGTFAGDPDEYVAKLIDHGKAETKAVDLPDGRTISITNSPAPAGGWVALHEDITERLRAERERDRTRVFLDTVVENVPATLVVKDAHEHRYVLVNRHGEEFFGMSREEMIGKNAYDFFRKEEADIITAHDSEVLQSGQSLFIENNPINTPRKGRRLVTTKRVAIRDNDGEPQYLLAFIEDVTERKRVEERIAYMAHHDALTDLPNRASFTEHLASTLDKAAKANESFAVVCIDLDRFKEVNDVFGHSTGDALLRAVSQRFEAAAEGAFLARLGGDEFTIIATGGEQPSTAVALAERLLATVADDVEIEGTRIRAGVSIGVAIFPADGADATTLLANADAALYRAKAEGRGTIRFFDGDMDKKLRERRSLQLDLQSALERNELVLHYQPLALIGGEIVGFEALVRWQHPSRGIVPPNVFIPLIEESGLIIPIGEWILREACREAASWPKPLQVAVNLSPAQFRQGDLPAVVHSVLLETGLAADRLELEITEGVLIADFSRGVSILRRLKALGVRIAMDDFGTGYSSLSYLQSFPFDKIKIDRTFISNFDRNPQSEAIIRAVIGLGRGLNLPVLAEGVETKDQLAFLSAESCDEVQGYLIGRPQPITAYAELTGGPATTLRNIAQAGGN